MIDNPSNPPAFPAHSSSDPSLLGRFLERVDGWPWSSRDCWNWSGYRTSQGYGVFSQAKKIQHRAHRFAFEAHHGKKAENMVLHLCDNPSCVNPYHLMDGTHKDNMRQMAERKRAARQERHHNSKLLGGEVIAIHALHSTGNYSTREIAAMLDISQPTVSAIITGRLWPDQKLVADAMLKARSEETP